MNVLTKKAAIESVPERWKKQYYDYWGRWEQGIWADHIEGDTEQIYKRLMALNPITEYGVNDILGDKQRWTIITCDYCYKDVESAVVMDVTYSETSTIICLECLRNAVNAIEQAIQAV